MKVLLILFSVFFISCTSGSKDENFQTLNDSAKNKNVNSQSTLKKIMDSILKAEGPNVKISIEGSESIKVSESEVKGINSSDLKTLDSRVLDSLIKMSKKKYTLVHFWATWCKPCRKEFPTLIKDVSKLHNADVILVSSDYDSEEQRKKVLAVYKKLDTQIPVYINQIYDKTDGMGMEAQIGLIKHYGLISDGGLPFNIMIENRSKKIVESTFDYKKLINDYK